MIPFLTEVLQLAFAGVVLVTALPVFKKIATSLKCYSFSDVAGNTSGNSRLMSFESKSLGGRL